MRTFFLILLLIPCLLEAKQKNVLSVMDAYSKKFAAEHQLEIVSSGGCSMRDSCICKWWLNLISRQQLTLEEARSLAADLSSRLLYILHHYPSPPHWHQVRDEFVGFRLTFWDQNTDRPLYPCIAQVKLLEGKLYYYYADPVTQALQEPIIESLCSLP